MVDVSGKAVTTRTAVAEGFVKMKPRVVAAVRRLRNPKGNPLEIARIAGISAAKRTSEWIPLCHPLPLTHIDVTARLCKNGVTLRSSVSTTAQTGVEMEALVADLRVFHPSSTCPHGRPIFFVLPLRDLEKQFERSPR